MKTRQGFVSNSSSSSFCILGVTSGEIESRVDLVKLNNSDKVYDDEDEDFDWWQYDKDDLEVTSGICEYNGYVIGISPEKMDENLTVAQNKEAVAEKINKAFGTTFTKDDMGFMTDGGYD